MRGAVLAGLTVGLVGGCGARTALSMTTYTDVSCDECKATPALVGRPVRILFDWPSTEPEPDGTVVGTVRWTVECVGAPCHLGAQRDDQVAGDGMVEVIPDGPGPMVVRVVLDDGMKQRTVELDQFMVAAVEAIELTCTTRPPSIRAYGPCGAEIPPGSDVRVVALVRGGGQPIAGVSLAAAIDGEVVASLTAPTAAAGWRCGVTPSLADPSQPEMACAADDIDRGAHVLVMSLGGVETALRLVVR